MELEHEIRPAPQASGQAKAAGSTVGATVAILPALLTPPPTPPTTSDHGSQDALSIQNTNEEAEEAEETEEVEEVEEAEGAIGTAHPEATALHTAEQRTSTTGGHNDRRRSADSSPPLSRVTTAVESIRNTFQSQLKTESSLNEDGVRVWTCTLTLNRAVIFFIAHFVVVFAVSFVGLFLQIWSMVQPSSSGVSLEQMQQLLQSSANEGSKMVLAALDHHSGDGNVNWQSLIRVLKACLNESGTNVSSITCEAALQAFNNNSSSTSEILRKRVELINTIQELSLHPPSAPSSGSSEYDVGFIVALVLCSFLLTLPWAVLLRQHAKSFLSSLLKFLTKRRTLLGKDKEFDARDEKEDDHLSNEIVGGSTTSISVQNGSSFGGSLNRRNNSRALRGEGDIWTAAVQGASDVVEELFYSPDAHGIDSVNSKFGTLLSAAARSGNKRLVNRILQWKPNLAVLGGHYHTALQSAAHSGNLDIVTLLLANGAPVDSVGGYYGTALNAAAEKGSSEMLQRLLEKDAAPKHTVNVRGGTYGYPIIAAASRGQLEMVKLLISKGADVNAADDSGTMALHTAAAGKHIAVVEELLRQGSDYDRRSKVYGTVLHVLTSSVAPSSEQEDIALMLVERGANITLTDRQLRTPLHEAARTGLKRLTLALMNTDDSNINAVDSGGNTALHHAAIGGHVEVVRQLIAHGIDVSIGDKFKAQALFRAAGCHHPDVVKLLLEAGADPNARDGFGRTALHGPAQTEDVSVQSMLLEAGAEVNAIGEDKKTPLHEACNMGRINNVKLLLSKPDVEVNLIDNDNCTALYRALRSTDGHYRDMCVDPKIVDLLLERDDIDVNAAHAIAFQEAARKGMVKTVDTMLSKRGANIHIQGGEYGGVIQAAAIGGHAEMLELLLSPQWRGNINTVGGEFGTPLAAAVAFGHFEASRVLLEAGARVDVTNVGRYSSAFHSVGRKMNGLDPLEKQHRCKELVALLERYAGKSLDSDADMPHLEDRWLQATNGWTFFPKGEL